VVGEVGHLALGPAVLSSGVPGSNLNITLGSAHNRPTNRTQNIDMTHFLWLDTSARCMGLVVGRFHKNVLSEGGGFFIQGLLWFFLRIPPCCHHEEFEQK